MNHHHQEDQEITLRQQFKKDHHETVGETDKFFDDSNYIEWLEKQIHSKHQLSKALAEASRELPDKEKTWEYIYRDTVLQKEGQEGFSDGANWMRDRAFEVIAVMHDENEDLEKCADEYVNTIFQLRKELSEKDKLLAEKDEQIHKLKYEAIEPDECDFERYPLPICFDPQEEQRELYKRSLKIDGDYIVWNEKYGK